MSTPTAVIAGIGQTEFSKNSGRSELQLAAEASIAAIRDAGLTPADIDGVVTFTARRQRRARCSMRSLGIPEMRFTGRAPAAAGLAPAPPSSSPPPR